MEFEKIILDTMERCYATAILTVDGADKIIFASEAIDGPCYAYSGDFFETKEVVWEKGGGTMSIVPLPHKNGEFLATQFFFPGFNAQDSKVVWGKFNKGVWEIKDFIAIPYLHRFDIFEYAGKLHFIGAVLCGSKKDREDWSDPGKVVVGIIPDDLTKEMEIKEIKSGLTKNHGYFKAEYGGVLSAYITAEEGVFVFIPPNEKCDTWQLEHIFDKPVSDVAVFDLDGDGQAEIATIEPFHGDRFAIYGLENGAYVEKYHYPEKINFAHALWSGEISGNSAVLCGIRRLNEELFLVTYDKDKKNYQAIIIEKSVGTANVCVLHQSTRDVIVAANHSKNEAAIYIKNRGV